MTGLSGVDIRPLSPARFAEVLASGHYERFGEVVRSSRALFHGRRVWNVNSTARGGGVAEMLAPLLAYAKGAGVDARWLVIGGNPAFFAVTKRLHNHLHGVPGDGGPLGEVERQIYEETLAGHAAELVRLVRPCDVVVLHDPQTAALTGPLKRRGAVVVWRCHVGIDTPNALAQEAWAFLRGYMLPADAYVFSRRTFVWDGLPPDRIALIAPSIDAFSPKNQAMAEENVAAILVATGMFEAADVLVGQPVFSRVDGRTDRVARRTHMYGAAAPPLHVPLVVQVSRWDRLKDPLGVMRGFARHVAPRSAAHLVLAGPTVAAVADDPEGMGVLNETADQWRQLPPEMRNRIHLACMPMEDAEENGAIVNALQRHATVVVQKSLAEGFGLTVSEAMWKGRPVVASRIGGIQDQIEHGVTGLLLDDPTDLGTFGDLLVELLEMPARAQRLGRAARERARELYLGPRHLTQYFELFQRLLEAGPRPGEGPCAPEAVEQRLAAEVRPPAPPPG